MLGFAKSERANAAKQRESAIRTASDGQQHIYDKRPDLKADRDALINSLIQQNEEPTAGPSKGSIPVDADLGSMSDDQLEEYLATHGGN
jgi:hypothetical protein